MIPFEKYAAVYNPIYTDMIFGSKLIKNMLNSVKAHGPNAKKVLKSLAKYTKGLAERQSRTISSLKRNLPPLKSPLATMGMIDRIRVKSSPIRGMLNRLEALNDLSTNKQYLAEVASDLRKALSGGEISAADIKTIKKIMKNAPDVERRLNTGVGLAKALGPKHFDEEIYDILGDYILKGF